MRHLRMPAGTKMELSNSSSALELDLRMQPDVQSREGLHCAAWNLSRHQPAPGTQTQHALQWSNPTVDFHSVSYQMLPAKSRSMATQLLISAVHVYAASPSSNALAWHKRSPVRQQNEAHGSQQHLLLCMHQGHPARWRMLAGSATQHIATQGHIQGRNRVYNRQAPLLAEALHMHILTMSGCCCS